MIIDFSDCQLSDRNLQYAGRAGEKRGIIYNNENWFLKFPKNTLGMSKVNGLSYATSPLSEYVGSNIYKILGYDVHETILGICNDGNRNKVVCACKDFIKDDKNEILIPYTALRNDTNKEIMKRNNENHISVLNLNEIIFQLEKNTILSRIRNVKKRFWDVVVIDLLINNNDRNEDNWGVIKYKNENKYKLAPVYDCGNSFYSKTSNQRIEMIMNDESKLQSSSLNIFSAYEDDDGHNIMFNDMIKNDNEDFKDSLSRVFNNVEDNLNEIENFIMDIPEKYEDMEIASKIRKEYYLETFKIRLNAIEKTRED